MLVKKYIPVLIVMLLLVLSSVTTFSQRNKDSVVYVSKYPVKKGYVYRFKNEPFSMADPSGIISIYSTDSSVFSVMEGTVKRIFAVEGTGFIMTGSKNTFVVYGNMDKCYKNVGDTIHKGELIGTIKRETAGDFFELLFQVLSGRKSLFYDDEIKFLQQIHDNKNAVYISLVIDGKKINIDNHCSFTIIHNSDAVKAKIAGHRLYVPALADSLDYVVVFKYKDQSLVFKRISRYMLLPDEKVSWEFGIDNRPFDESLYLLSDYQYENNKTIRQLQYVRLEPEHGDGWRFVNEIKFSQAPELKKRQLSNKDVKKGIWAYYKYEARDSYGYIGLTLFKKGTYLYKMETASRSCFSEGKWIMKENKLSLTSNIKKDDLPVKVNYLNDVESKNNNFKIAIVKDLRGELLTDAFVYINNDSLQCLPLTETCLGAYDRIDSIKVVLENGMRSKWMKVEQKAYIQLQPVLQLDFKVSSYEAMNGKKYKVMKSSVRPLE